MANSSKGSNWTSLGGDIGTEVNCARPNPSRYVLDGRCSIILDSEDVPIVAWTGLTRTREYRSCVARWSQEQQKWEGLNPAFSNRDASIHVDINAQDRLFATTTQLATSSEDVNVTHAWSWTGDTWERVGNDIPNTGDARLAVYGDTLYLALLDEKTNHLSDLGRWREV